MILTATTKLSRGSGMPTWYASEAAVAAASRRALGTRGPSLCITTALAMAPITERQLAPTRRLETKVRTRNLVSCSLHHQNLLVINSFIHVHGFGGQVGLVH